MADAMNDDDTSDLDRAFRTALATSPPEDPHVTRRRRQAVLAAVDAALAPAPARAAASNEPQWRTLPPWWRGAAAASVLVCSTLIVSRLAVEPVAQTPAAGAEQAEPAAALAGVAATPAAVSSVPPPAIAAPAPRQPALRQLPMPAAAQVAPSPPLDRIATLPPVPVSPPPAALADRPTNDLPRANASDGRAGGRLQAAPALTSSLAPGPAMGVKPGDTDPARRLQPAPGPDHDRDADGRTRLMRAVLRGDAAIATLLLQQGADPLATDHLGQSARGYAAASGNPELLKVFDLAP